MATPRRDDAPDPRRDAVRQLAGQGLSNRAIARIHGVSEATVRRWRHNDAPADSDAPATQDDLLTIPLDDALRRDLATMADVGLDPVEAVRTALAHMAGTYETAWALGAVPYGTEPRITDSIIQPPPVPPSTDDCHTPLPHCP
jgi:hypothetical protein